jgi:outer membrane protein insertion porin family
VLRKNDLDCLPEPSTADRYLPHKNMRFKFKVLLVATVATIAQFNYAPAQADSTQIERLVSQPSLASAIVDRQSVAVSDRQNLASISTAKDLIAQSKRKRKSAPRQQPVKPPTAPTNPQTQLPPPATSPANQKQVLVSDIIIKSPKGALAPALESKVRQVLSVKAGQPTTREQLEQNLNAIRALGDFSAVEIVPEDTAKGVKLSFLVRN